MPTDFLQPNAAEFIRRLALGTVQFGLAYGINNTAGRPATETVDAILQLAQAQGISLLDTAAAYGDSESRLGTWLSAPDREPVSFQIVTKVAAGPAAQVRQQLQESLGRLGQPRVYGVLFHQFEAFSKHPEAWQALQEARAAGMVQRIGVSLYHPEEAEWLLNELPDVGLVQVPFNVLDQRFGALLPELERRGVEVHVRSAFLQGLLLREPASLPSFFAPLANKITRLRALAADANVPVASLLLVFAALAPGVSRVVVGVDTPANLRDNLAAATHVAQAEALRPELLKLAETTTNFILPYTWPPRS